MGGQYSHLAHSRYRLEWLIPLGIVFQVVGPTLLCQTFGVRSAPAALACWSLGSVMLLGACFVNAHHVGFVLVGFGVGLNLIAIVSNAGMPVSPRALETLGVIHDVDQLAALTPLYHLQTPATRLAVLADVLPIPGPPIIRSVASIGDVVLMVGVALVILDSSRSLFRPLAGISATSSPSDG
ncbi:MAG: DUF5317 family protein [Coriobacteriia bacterium]|nr:DUF5317 family protein [Coriobacteriia bacterium]